MRHTHEDVSCQRVEDLLCQRVGEPGQRQLVGRWRRTVMPGVQDKSNGANGRNHPPYVL